MLVLFFAFIVVVDQLTKFYAFKYLLLGEPVAIIPGVFNFTLVMNPGAAFGLFSGLDDVLRWVALGSVSLIALVVVLRFLFVEAKNDPVSRVALTGILSGALGNLIDRLRYDAVIDFLDFYINNLHWPAFNIADSAITLGVTVLIIQSIFKNKKEQQASLIEEFNSN